jgi:Domain of unknown function (DUF932)
MNAVATLSFSSNADAFTRGLSIDAIRERAPAVFASSADEGRSLKYTFIPTEKVLAGLMSAGFVPVEARQAMTRRASVFHARHVLRLRRRCETVLFRDQSIPEVVFLNSHDGSSTYLMWILACHHCVAFALKSRRFLRNGLLGRDGDRDAHWRRSSVAGFLTARMGLSTLETTGLPPQGNPVGHTEVRDQLSVSVDAELVD